MFRFILPLAILVTATFAEDLPVLGVIGGTLAAPGQFPFQVSIEINGHQHCGGTLIALNALLTAAHCLDHIDPNLMTVLAGTNNRLAGGVRARVASYARHEFYDPNTKAYDIAVIFLDRILQESRFIKPADLPEKDELVYNNQVGSISGWGVQYHQGPTTTALNFVKIPLWSIEYCRQTNPYSLASTHLCAGDISGQKNACPGDSGGPLSMGNKLVGIVSAGFGCGKIFSPALYTYVAGLRDWISTNTGV